MQGLPNSSVASAGISNRPLVPAMLNDLIGRFSPRRAAMVAGPAPANGKLSMAQVRCTSEVHDFIKGVICLLW